MWRAIENFPLWQLGYERQMDPDLQPLSTHQRSTCRCADRDRVGDRSGSHRRMPTSAWLDGWELDMSWWRCRTRRVTRAADAVIERTPHAPRRCRREGWRTSESVADFARQSRQHASGEAGAGSEQCFAREGNLLSTAPASTETPRSNFSPHEKPTWELYSNCVHCGLCLDQCPTYRALGTEMDSPRGRIYQIVQVDARAAGAQRFVRNAYRSLPGLPELPDGMSVGRGVWQLAGAGAGTDRGELPAAVAGDEAAQTFLRRHSAVFSSPGAPCAVHSLLSAFGTAIAGARDRSAEAAGSGRSWMRCRRESTASFRFQIWVACFRRKASGAAGSRC